MVRAGAARAVVRRVPLSAKELFRALVGRRTGIVREVAFADTIDGDAPLFHAGAELANAHRAHDDDEGEHLRAGGVGKTRDDAITSALGEAVERYAAGRGCAATVVARRRDLEGRSLDPAAFARFSGNQRALPGFPFVRADDETVLRWVRGQDLVTGEPTWVPAFAVHVPYENDGGEPLVDAQITTGLACAPTLAEATARGAREVVERDALALVFLRGLTPPRIAANDVERIAGALLPPRDAVRAFDVTTDAGATTILVVAFGEGPRGEIVSLGAACDPDPERALRKAAIEASQDRVFVRLLMEEEEEPIAEGFTNVTDFAKHARLYSGRPELARRALAFLDGGVIVAVPDRERDVAIRGAVVDLTPPWAAALGLHVARVVAPELVPLHGSHVLRYEGHPRLAEIATAMPRAELRHDHPLWPYPHAMP